MVWMFVSQQNDVLQKTSQEGILSCPKNQTAVWLINYLKACAVFQLYKALVSKQLQIANDKTYQTLCGTALSWRCSFWGTILLQ